MITFYGCVFNSKKVTQITDHCFIISDYNKTLCLEVAFDSLYPVIYVDKNKFEMRNNKFTNLKMYVMMVVEIDEESVVFSNVNYSIKVEFENLNTESGVQLKIQDMYYVIVQRIHLSDSKIIIRSNGVKEELPDGESDIYGDDSSMMDLGNGEYDDGIMDDVGSDGYDDIDDP
jgi:hypothetical protein